MQNVHQTQLLLGKGPRVSLTGMVEDESPTNMMKYGRNTRHLKTRMWNRPKYTDSAPGRIAFRMKGDLRPKIFVSAMSATNAVHQSGTLRIDVRRDPSQLILELAYAMENRPYTLW